MFKKAPVRKRNISQLCNWNKLSWILIEMHWVSCWQLCVFTRVSCCVVKACHNFFPAANFRNPRPSGYKYSTCCHRPQFTLLGARVYTDLDITTCSKSGSSSELEKPRENANFVDDRVIKMAEIVDDVSRTWNSDLLIWYSQTVFISVTYDFKVCFYGLWFNY